MIYVGTIVQNFKMYPIDLLWMFWNPIEKFQSKLSYAIIRTMTIIVETKQDVGFLERLRLRLRTTVTLNLWKNLFGRRSVFIHTHRQTQARLIGLPNWRSKNWRRLVYWGWIALFMFILCRKSKIEWKKEATEKKLFLINVPSKSSNLLFFLDQCFPSTGEYTSFSD